MADHKVLFLPGPTEVRSELLQRMAGPLLGHRDPDFVAVVAGVCRELAGLYRTTQPTAFESCPATALMEAAIRNFVPPGGHSLHLVGGAFGQRFFHIAEHCGRRPEALCVPAGSAHTAELLRQRLLAGSTPEAIVITHNETSTGVLQPLRELCAVAHSLAPAALLLVDAVTSLAGAELEFDDWGLDFAFAGTQKCLALPPGICTYAVAERALDRATAIPDRGFLLDLPRAVRETMAGKTLATPNIPLVYALQAQLQHIAAEGLAARWQRHRSLRDAVLDFAVEAGLLPFVAEPVHRSPTVSCLAASATTVAAMVARAKAAGYAIDGGYGPWQGKTIRIGHMGDHHLEDLQALLQAMRENSAAAGG